MNDFELNIFICLLFAFVVSIFQLFHKISAHVILRLILMQTVIVTVNWLTGNAISSSCSFNHKTYLIYTEVEIKFMN